MFANAVVDSCSTCIRKSVFSLMSRLNTSINVIVPSTLNTKDGLRRYTLNAYFLSLYNGQNVFCTFTSEIKDYYCCLLLRVLYPIWCSVDEKRDALAHRRMLFHEHGIKNIDSSIFHIVN